MKRSATVPCLEELSGKKPCLAPATRESVDKIQLTPWLWVEVNESGVVITRHPIDPETPPNRAVLDGEGWTRLKTAAGILPEAGGSGRVLLSNAWYLTTTTCPDGAMFVHIKRWRQYRPDGPLYPTKEGVTLNYQTNWQRLVQAIPDIAALRGESEPAETVEKEEAMGVETSDPSSAGAAAAATACAGGEPMTCESPERSAELPTELETTLTALLWQAYESALHPHVLQFQRKALTAAGVPVVGTSIDQTRALLQDRDKAMGWVDEACLRHLREGGVLAQFTRKVRKAVLPWEAGRDVKAQLQQFLNETPIKKSNPFFARMYVDRLAATTPLGTPPPAPPASPSTASPTSSSTTAAAATAQGKASGHDDEKDEGYEDE